MKKLLKLRFKTSEKTVDDVKKDYSSNPPSDEMCERIAEVYRNLHGAEVIGMAWDYSPETYSIYDWSDEADEKIKEFIYLQEQDEFFGSYINDRKRFESDWADGMYEASGAMHFDKTDFDIVNELKTDFKLN